MFGLENKMKLFMCKSFMWPLSFYFPLCKLKKLLQSLSKSFGLKDRRDRLTSRLTGKWDWKTLAIFHLQPWTINTAETCRIQYICILNSVMYYVSWKEFFCRCIKIALVHDMAESIVGDITPADGLSKAEKRHKEEVINTWVNLVLMDCLLCWVCIYI